MSPGANVTIRHNVDGRDQFIARIDGIPEIVRGKISVTPLLTLEGDVNFDTGNLEFAGEVLIKGSVTSGFSVKAERDITVTGKIEAGGCLESKGNITVSGSITGRRTKVTASGNVRAQKIVDSHVTAGGDVILGAGARNAYLRAGEKLTIERGADAGIVGGEVWVGRSIHLVTAGAPEGVPTTLVVGLQPDQADRLDQLKQKIGIVHEQTLRLLKKFALGRVDLSQIRNMISASRGPNRRILIRYATQLGQLATLHRKFNGQRQELEHSIWTAVDEVEILLTGQAYPGVRVRIGGGEHMILEGRQGARFFVTEGGLQVE